MYTHRSNQWTKLIPYSHSTYRVHSELSLFRVAGISARSFLFRLLPWISAFSKYGERAIGKQPFSLHLLSHHSSQIDHANYRFSRDANSTRLSQIREIYTLQLRTWIKSSTHKRDTRIINLKFLSRDFFSIRFGVKALQVETGHLGKIEKWEELDNEM